MNEGTYNGRYVVCAFRKYVCVVVVGLLLSYKVTFVSFSFLFPLLSLNVSVCRLLSGEARPCGCKDDRHTSEVCQQSLQRAAGCHLSLAVQRPAT